MLPETAVAPERGRLPQIGPRKGEKRPARDEEKREARPPSEGLVEEAAQRRADHRGDGHAQCDVADHRGRPFRRVRVPDDGTREHHPRHDHRLQHAEGKEQLHRRREHDPERRDQITRDGGEQHRPSAEPV